VATFTGYKSIAVGNRSVVARIAASGTTITREVTRTLLVTRLSAAARARANALDRGAGDARLRAGASATALTATTATAATALTATTLASAVATCVCRYGTSGGWFPPGIVTAASAVRRTAKHHHGEQHDLLVSTKLG